MSAPLPRPGTRPAFHMPSRPAPADDQWAAWLQPAGIPAPVLARDDALWEQWRANRAHTQPRDLEMRDLP